MGPADASPVPIQHPARRRRSPAERRRLRLVRRRRLILLISVAALLIVGAVLAIAGGGGSVADPETKLVAVANDSPHPPAPPLSGEAGCPGKKGPPINCGGCTPVGQP